MDGDPEPIGHLLSQRWWSLCRIVGPEALQKSQDLAGQLVPPARTALLRQEAR